MNNKLGTHWAAGFLALASLASMATLMSGCPTFAVCGESCGGYGGSGTAGATTTTLSTGGTSGTPHCVNPEQDCTDNDPCTDPVCKNGECATEPVNEMMPCGEGGGAGAAGGALPTHCENGECIGCQDDSQCPPSTDCRTWKCDTATSKCMSTDLSTESLMQVEGDCKKKTCNNGGLIVFEDTEDKPKPIPGEETLCKIWGCSTSMPNMPSAPIVGAPVAAGTECMTPTCVQDIDGVHFTQTTSVCDGNGTCQAAVKMSCGSAICDGVSNKCKTNCATDKGDGDCTTDAFCNHPDPGSPTGLCVAKYTNGTDCSSANMCVSGFCADGVCCENDCSGICKSCAVNDMLKGTCSPIPADTDPGNECSGALVCNGAGLCGKLSNGQPCILPMDCQSNKCVDGVCCNSDCLGECKLCNAAGSVGTCTNIPEGQTSGACAGISACDGNGTCKFVDGSVCFGDSVCLSGFCTDISVGVGICCESACTSGCKSCKPNNGMCSNVSDGSACNKNNGTAGTCNNNVCN